jgi:hypothetical protein
MTFMFNLKPSKTFLGVGVQLGSSGSSPSWISYWRMHMSRGARATNYSSEAVSRIVQRARFVPWRAA